MNRQQEHHEQSALFHWAHLEAGKYPELSWLYAVPNGARTSIHVAKKLKAEGLKPGVFDIGLDIPRGQYHGMKIEMKSIYDGKKKGTVSKEQKKWKAHYEKNGFYAIICYTWQDAAEKIIQYLELK